MSRAKEPFVPASILPSRPLAQRAAAALVSPDRKTTPNGGASSTAATLAAAADAAFTAAEQSTSSSSNSNPKVTMYVCGVTVYDLSHIGHARAYVAFDVLLRFLSKALKYDVRYVRNFTDVDDKIIARAAKLMMQEEKEGGGANGNGNGNGNGAAPATTAVSAEAALALASRFIDEFRADMTALHCLPPADEPRATQYLDEMVRTIERIIDHGHAYSCGDGSGDVFFDVRSLPNYGLLSGRTDQSVNRAGASERVAVDPRKRDAADFALWKGAKAGEPSWPSPWGPGRPGWHIECSAMIRAVLGEDPIDIHGGGRDLVFPHHENELAQSRAALAPCGCCEGGGEAGAVVAAAEEEGGEEDVAASSGPSSRKPPLPPPEDRDFVRYWVHNGFVNVDSEKMSKSLGNFFTIRDASASHGALTLRWLLVGSHYRQPLYYTQRALDEAADRLFYVYQALADADAALQEAAKEAADVAAAGAGTAAAADDANQKAKKAPATDPPPPSPTEALAYILAGKGPGGALASAASASLADDLNTPAAVGALSPALKALNDLLHTRAGRRTKGRPSLIASYRAALSYVLGDLLGFPTHEPESALASLRAAALRRAGLTEEALGERVAARAEARANKDFAAADAVRAELAAKGVFLMDAASGSGGGSAWRPGVPEEEQEGEAKGDAAAAAAAEAPA
jgi:cysteinyl-tRNA synthetase